MKISDIAVYLYSALSIAATVIVAIEAIRRLRQIPNLDDRDHGATLTSRQKIYLLLLPPFVTFGCVLWQIQFPQAWQDSIPLWIICLFVFFMLASPFLRSSARWFGVPQILRQAADYIVYGVIISFVIMILVTYASEIMHP